MPSFDIVCRTNLAEVDNALANLTREIRQRFDFKESKSTISRENDTLTIHADDEYKLKQLQDLLRTHLIRRSVEPDSLEFKTAEKAMGDSLRQTVAIRQGIPQEQSKKVVKAIKDAGLKVQAAIQGEELRVIGKKRDDLQAAITLVRGLKLGMPFQFVNMRE